MNEARRRGLTFTVTDCRKELLKKKKLLFLGLVVGALCALFSVLSAPLYFKAQATYFNDASKASHTLPLNGQAGLFTSQKFLRRAAEKAGLQIKAAPLGLFEAVSARLWDHLSSSFVLPFRHPAEFSFSSVRFLGSEKKKIYLRFLSSETFEVLDEKYEFLTRGQVRRPVQIEEIYFTLQKTPLTFSIDGLYSFILLPWHELFPSIEKHLRVSPDPFDPRLLHLSYRDEMGHVAASFLNQLMLGYHQFALHEAEEAKLAARGEKAESKREIPPGGDALLALCNAQIDALRQIYDLEVEEGQLPEPPQGAWPFEKRTDLTYSLSEAKDAYFMALRQLRELSVQVEEISFCLESVERGEVNLPLLEKSVGLAHAKRLSDWTHFLSTELSRPEEEKNERLIREKLHWQEVLRAHLSERKKGLEIDLSAAQRRSGAFYLYAKELVCNQITLARKHLAEIEQRMLTLSKVEKEESKSVPVEEPVAQTLLSHPLDFAENPQAPLRSPLLARIFFWAVGGALLPTIGILLIAAFTGLPLSLEMLKRWNLPSAGEISSRLDSTLDEMDSADLQTLRHMAAFFSPHKKEESALTIALCGRTAELFPLVASLFARKGASVLLVQTSCSGKGGAAPGLYQYLEGELTSYPIYQRKEYDFLPSGSAPLHAAELTTSSQFRELLGNLQQEYDVLLLCSSCLPFSAESLELLRQSDAGALSIVDEKSPHLLPFLKNLSTPRAIPVIFVTHKAGNFV